MASSEEYGPQAEVPENWPPHVEDMARALTEIFGQHLVQQRDHILRSAYEIVVNQHPYARGRVHQRPFAALNELPLSQEERDKLVDVIAVFVDEAVEGCLRLIGSATNTVGDFYTTEYRLTSQIVEHEEPAAERYSLSTLVAGWKQNLGQMFSEQDQDRSEESGRGQEAAEEESEVAVFPPVELGTGEALWFEYRKWLSRYCRFRRSARPSHS